MIVRVYNLNRTKVAKLPPVVLELVGWEKEKELRLTIHEQGKDKWVELRKVGK